MTESLATLFPEPEPILSDLLYEDLWQQCAEYRTLLSAAVSSQVDGTQRFQAAAAMKQG